MATQKSQQSINKRIVGLLDDCLTQHFGISDKSFHKFIEDNCTYIDLVTGDRLISQGDTSDDVFFLLSGRLRALIAQKDGRESVIGEIGRGETVGELAMFTGKARSASVVAIRDSVAVQISRDTLETAMSKQPGIALKITQQVIERYERMRALHKPPSVPVSITVLPVTPNVDAADIARKLAEIRRAKGDNILVIDNDYVARDLGGLESPDTSQPRGPVSLALGDLETQHDALFFIADPDNMAWSHTAVHHSDEVLIVADSKAEPSISDIERTLFPDDETLRAKITLALIHDADSQSPGGTANWLAPRQVARHVHIRRGSDKDIGRLSRVLSGRAIGLVLAGGGARGLAHIGVYKALCETGIDIDMIGGTSAGAIMGAWIAMDVTGEDIVAKTRPVFVDPPGGDISSDYNMLPIISLIKGQRAWKTTRKAVLDNAGADIDIEDSWKSFYTITSDYSTQSERVLDRGNFARNLVASFSIPGLMPPCIIDGHLMFDGGTFNNFPVDEMRKRGAGVIIGVDLMSDFVREYDLEYAPSSLALLRDKFRPKAKRKYKLPSLPITLLNSSVVTSMSRQKALRDHVDLLFQPNVRGVTMLDWKKYDGVVENAKIAALEQLSQMDEAQLKDYRA